MSKVDISQPIESFAVVFVFYRLKTGSVGAEGFVDPNFHYWNIFSFAQVICEEVEEAARLEHAGEEAGKPMLTSYHVPCFSTFPFFPFCTG